MSSELDQLMEMGFPKNRAEKALAKTYNKGVEVAMEWLFAHSEDPDIDEPYVAPQGHVLGKETTPAEAPAEAPAEGSSESAMETEGAKGEENSETAQQANSFKCDDCGKLLKSEVELQAHAARTNHSNFSESTETVKALSEEEKKEQLARLQDRLKQRRLEKEGQEKSEQLKREKMRRATGKEMVSAKAKMQELEMKKIVEERRREKEQEKMARQKVKEQIERDKRERAAKFPKAGQEAQPTATAASPTSPPPSSSSQPAASPPAEPAAKKQYDTCRLQIRLTNGAALTQQFNAHEELAAVRLYIQMNRTDGEGEFKMRTSFPPKVFTEDDMAKPLVELGLVPSAVIIVSRA